MRGYRDNEPPPVTLAEVRCLIEEDRSVLFDFDGEEIWIPRSHILEGESDEFERGTVGTLTITAWVAKQEGLD